MPEKLEPITTEKKHLEKLEELEPYPYWLKPLPEDRKPRYTEHDKTLIAWSIAWEGSIELLKGTNQHFIPTVELKNTDYDLLNKFFKIVKIGHISRKGYASKQKHKPAKNWRIESIYEVFFFLQQIVSYIPSKRKQEVAYLLIQFCKIRMRKHEKARKQHTHPEGYNQREVEIYNKTHKLNKRGF